MRNQKIEAFLREFVSAAYVATDTSYNHSRTPLPRALVTSYQYIGSRMAEVGMLCGFSPLRTNDSAARLLVHSLFERSCQRGYEHYYFCAPVTPENAPTPEGFARLWKLRALAAVLK